MYERSLLQTIRLSKTRTPSTRYIPTTVAMDWKALIKLVWSNIFLVSNFYTAVVARRNNVLKTGTTLDPNFKRKVAPSKSVDRLETDYGSFTSRARRFEVKFVLSSSGCCLLYFYLIA